MSSTNIPSGQPEEFINSFNPEAHNLDQDFRLTNFAELRGWGCKVPQEILDRYLAGLEQQEPAQDPPTSAGAATSDSEANSIPDSGPADQRPALGKISTSTLLFSLDFCIKYPVGILLFYLTPTHRHLLTSILIRVNNLLSQALAWIHASFHCAILDWAWFRLLISFTRLWMTPPCRERLLVLMSSATCTLWESPLVTMYWWFSVCLTNWPLSSAISSFLWWWKVSRSV